MWMVRYGTIVAIAARAGWPVFAVPAAIVASPLDDINPADTGPIEIIEGAGVTALYETEAA